MAALQEGARCRRRASRASRLSSRPVVAVLGALFIAAGMYGPGGTTQRLGTHRLRRRLRLRRRRHGEQVPHPAARRRARLAAAEALAGQRPPGPRQQRRAIPARTAATASALMIGLGVVVFVAVFAQGLKSSFIDSFDQTVRADYIVQGKNFLPLPVRHARHACRPSAACRRAAGSTSQQVQVNEEAAPTSTASTRPRSRASGTSTGSRAAATPCSQQLGTEQRARRGADRDRTGPQDRADASRLTTVDGKTRDAQGQRAVQRDPMLLNGIVVSNAGYNALFPKPQLFMVLAKAAPGSGRRARQLGALKTALADVPTAEVKTVARVQGQRGQAGRPAAQPAVRAAGDERDHLAVRHRQHAGAGRLRAHARDRPPARHRHVATPGAGHGALRERHHLDHRRAHGHRRRRSCSPGW